MKKLISLIIVLFFIALESFPQDFKTDSLSKSEISKLNFLIGNWEGKGWMMGPDRNRSEFDQTEKIQLNLTLQHY